MSLLMLLPSDVNTQASYQLLDPNFIGLIFSCFNDSDKVGTVRELGGLLMKNR